MSIPLWVIPTAITLLLNGIITFLPKIALRTLGLYDLIVYQAFFIMIGASILQVFYGGPELQLAPALMAAGTGAVGATGQILYLNAVRHGMLTHVSMVSSLYPWISTVLAFMILHEPLTARQACGIVLALFAIFLLVVSDDGHKRS